MIKYAIRFAKIITFLLKQGWWCMKHFTLSFILFLASLFSFAAPARYDNVTLTQPDGTRFTAILSGDEFMKIKVTETGEAIIQDEDGWWSYAVYDVNGNKKSTGCHVGAATSETDLAPSRNIPYDLLAYKATLKRKQAEYNRVQRTPTPVMLKASAELTQKNKAGLVILAQFKDASESFRYTRDKFVAMLNQRGYADNGATGSAKQYFDDQFNGMYEFSFDVPDVIVTLSQNRAYYGGNTEDGSDIRPQYMIVEACELADQYVDFSKYDQDGDGEVDNVFVFFAGLDEASGAAEYHIWSHSWYIKDGAKIDLTLDGVVINRYACSSELLGSDYRNAIMTSIGTFCHEYSHTLGLMDLYDTDYDQGGCAAATWRYTSLMDGGNYNNNSNTPPYFNGFERAMLGISDPIEITTAGTYELPPINEGVYYQINTTTENEIFLIEYRDGKGWDAHMGGSGVMIYHVDLSTKPSGLSYRYGRDVPAYYRWYSNELNALAAHQCVDIIEADQREDQYTSYTNKTYRELQNSLAGIFFPYQNTNYITPNTSPGLVCWGDTEVKYALTGIKVENGKASFRVVGFSPDAMPVPTDIEIESFQDCAILSFGSTFEFSGDAEITYGESGKDPKTVIVPSYEIGRWAVELSGLKPSTSYTVRIAFKLEEFLGDFANKTFMTKKQKSTGLPYIYFATTERNEDGSFATGTKTPLKVYNAVGAKKISWTFNGKEITTSPDGYYHINASGTLEAHITWEDESEEVIIKKIRVSDK